MQIETNKLIDELLLMTERSSNAVMKFKSLSLQQLNFKKNPDSWSILECVEHLNLYGDYYLPEIEKQMIAHGNVSKNLMFKSGLVGNYFANLMIVKDGKLTKMKSPKDKNPAKSDLSITALDRFLKQQELLKSLLIKARTKDLTKIKTPISLSRMIKLRLGDTFRFVIYHIERHILQAESVLTTE